VRVSNDLSVVVSGAEVVIIAVIASYMREIANRLCGLVGPDTLVVHGTKGLEPSTWLRLSVVLGEALDRDSSGRVAVLAGPNHAEEVARGLT
jgi:glycerol-3-phosphate dehydrogenase (NAD(P)+)